MVNVQYYCFLTNIITKTKICESETTFFNFVNLPKREKIPLTGRLTVIGGYVNLNNN